MNESADPMGTMATDALQLFLDAVEQIPAESWAQASNLAGWSIRELVGHATGSAAKVVALVEGGQIWAAPSEPSDWASDDPAARLRELATRLQQVLPEADFAAPRTSPAGEAPLGQAMAFPVADLALHSWDVHRSLGREVELPTRLLGLCRQLVESLPEDRLRRPGAFGPAQPAPQNATPTARLMAYLGRSVGSAT
ncbi:TIGR03086 family protein [Mycobacterium gordonae]|nr:TIGR03086 family metal-binding protein [Mycobacterium gordonae]OBJ77160.1 TIGR03086 family protein [Mycobacterium gordonae]